MAIVFGIWMVFAIVGFCMPGKNGPVVQLDSQSLDAMPMTSGSSEINPKVKK